MNPGFHLSCDENLSKGWGPPLRERGTPSSEHPFEMTSTELELLE